MGKRTGLFHSGVLPAATAALALNIVSIGAAHAGSNFPAVQDYPSPNCAKPGAAPVLPASAMGRPAPTSGGGPAVANQAVNGYNQKIAEYNAAQLAYAACINAYAANAQADLDLIRSKASKNAPNFPALKDYPAPDCGEPVNQPASPVPGPADTVQSANQRTKDYNTQIAKFNIYAKCVNAYTSNAQADMDLIRDKVNKAVADSKGVQ